MTLREKQAAEAAAALNQVLEDLLLLELVERANALDPAEEMDLYAEAA